MSEVIDIEINNRRMVIGNINGSVFSKNVSKEKHLYRKLNSWGIDAVIFDKVILPRCNKIVIFDKDNRQEYSVSPKKWKQHGIYLQHKPFRSQTFLPLDFFKIESK